MEDSKGKQTRVRSNGEGTVFKMPSGRWRTEVTVGWDTLPDGTKKRRVKTKSGFKLQRDAIKAIALLKQAPTDIDVKITFKDLYMAWSAAHYKTISKDMEYVHVAAYKQCTGLYYKPFASLKTPDLQQPVDDCQQKRRSKQAIKALFTGMYKYALQNDYCNKNYAVFVKLPRKEKSTTDAFTQAERDILWADYHAGKVFTGYILSMIYLGTRYGEISILRKENIHLDKQYIVGGIKSEAGTDRIIPICDKLLPVITQIYESSTDKILDIPDKVFYNRFYETLRRLEVRELKPHACRHTCATALAEEGVQPAIIQAILGHASYETTMQYTHVQKLPLLLEGVNKLK